MWKNNAKYVKMVYLSDVNKFSRYPMALRMVITLDQADMDKKGNSALLELFSWMLSFSQRMSKVRMNVNDKREARKNR